MALLLRLVHLSQLALGSAPVSLATENIVIHRKRLDLWEEQAKDILGLTCSLVTDPSLSLWPLGTWAAYPAHR